MFHVDGIGSVELELHARLLQQILVDTRHFDEHGILDLDDVGAKFAIYREEQHRLAVDEGLARDLEMIQPHAGNIGKSGELITAARQYQLAE